MLYFNLNIWVKKKCKYLQIVEALSYSIYSSIGGGGVVYFGSAHLY